MRKSLLVATLTLLPTMAMAQQSQPDALDGTNPTAGFGITPSGVAGSPTTTIMTLSQNGEQINGSIQAIAQNATAGVACPSAGAVSYDVINDQIIYCSKKLIWTRQSGGDSGSQCGSAVFQLDGYYGCGYLEYLEPCEGSQIINLSYLVFGNTCYAIVPNCPSGYHLSQYSMPYDPYTAVTNVASCFKN